MYKSRDKVRDYVFPLVSGILHANNEYAHERFLGTAFLIGNRGYALTAKHVLSHEDIKHPLGIFAGEDRKWYAFDIVASEPHPTEDICIVRLNGQHWQSPFLLHNEWEGGWCDYFMCGYPSDLLYEDLTNQRPDSTVLPRPDLVHTKGHIRRRVSRDLGIPNVQGSQFFELSAVAGAGCSGAPVFIRTPRPKAWSVVGIYVGERLDDRSTSVSYAVRVDAIVDWRPQILDCTVLQESEKLTPWD